MLALALALARAWAFVLCACNYEQLADCRESCIISVVAKGNSEATDSLTETLAVRSSPAFAKFKL